MAFDDDVRAAQRAAVWRADRLATQLRTEGYDFVLISITKLLVHPDTNEHAGPGTTVVVGSNRINPILPAQSDNLRKIALDLDAQFERSGDVAAACVERRDVTREYRS